MVKKQFFVIPDEMKEKEWWGFHWLEHVTAIPAPLVLVTGYKENGCCLSVLIESHGEEVRINYILSP